jgi:hypothetical protein
MEIGWKPFMASDIVSGEKTKNLQLKNIHILSLNTKNYFVLVIFL